MQGIFPTLVAPLGRLLGVPRQLLGSGVDGLRSVFQLLVVAGFVWFAASSLWIFPHSLSYANELIGGPVHLPEHLLSSNVDWGQDLRYLDWWLEEHPKIRDIHLAYYGYFDPKDIGFHGVQTKPIQILKSPFENVAAVRAQNGKLSAGWHSISVNILYGQRWAARSGNQHSARLDKEALTFLLGLPTTNTFGYSIRNYHLPLPVSMHPSHEGVLPAINLVIRQFVSK